MQFSMSHLFAHSLNIKHYQVPPLRPRVDPGVMTLKKYSAFPETPALLEPHQHIQHTRWTGVLTLCRDAVSVFYSLSQLRY